MTATTSPSPWEMHCTGAEAYERYIVPAWMGAWAQALVESGGVAPGARVLDVACGTGIVARKAVPVVEAGGTVTGVDASEAMLREASRFASQQGMRTIDWRQGDVTSLPCDTAAYDVVLCQQGLQFFPDRPAALREMRRVMVPGGRLALSVWRAFDRFPLFTALADVLEAYFGVAASAIFRASVSLSDREALRTLLREAGFCDIHIRVVVKMARYPSVAEFLPGYLSVFPVVAAIAAMREADRAAMFSRMATLLHDFMDDDGLAAPMESHVVTASR
jgi:ubiquinone/menaquinone biosynthesis C-methylase UbiE